MVTQAHTHLQNSEWQSTNSTQQGAAQMQTCCQCGTSCDHLHVLLGLVGCCCGRQGLCRALQPACVQLRVGGGGQNKVSASNLMNGSASAPCLTLFGVFAKLAWHWRHIIITSHLSECVRA